MGNTIMDRISATDNVEPIDVTAKRGKSTPLQKGLTAARRFATSGEVPDDADIVELEPDAITFLEAVNHREQEWLSIDNKSFSSLIKSIEQVGQKIPILVRPKDGGGHELIYGSRRRGACAHLGIKVKALIVHGVSDNEAHELAILENTNHTGLSPLEEARAVLAYKERNAPISVDQVAVIFSKSKTWVSFQNSFANLDSLFIDACLDPWSITERATREIRSGKVSYKRAINSLKGEKVPFVELIKIINGTERSKPEEITDDEGRLIAEVFPPSSKHGRTKRTVSLYQGADQKTVNELMTTILGELNA